MRPTRRGGCSSVGDASGHPFSNAYAVHFCRRKACPDGHGRPAAASNCAHLNPGAHGACLHDHAYPDASANHPGCHRHSRSTANRAARYGHACPDSRPNRSRRHACPHADANPTASDGHTCSNPYACPAG